VIKAHPDWVTRVDLDADLPPDLDTMDDYERMKQLGDDGPLQQLL
jgi:hypothetical protein